MAVELRLVCWNLHGSPLAAQRRKRRLEAAAAALLRLSPRPDVALLQELFFPRDLGRVARRLGAGYRLVDGAPRKAFPPWFLPLLNVGGLFARIRCGGLAAFVAQSWQVRGHHFEKFEAEECDLKIWRGDGYADKGLQRLDLRHRASGQDLVLFNTHLQAGRAQERIRAAQLAQLARAAAAVPAHVPVLIAGDFNLRPTSPLYRRIVHDLAWRDLTRFPPSCGTSFDRAAVNARWRDYIFLRSEGGWEVRALVRMICNTRPDVPYSDHHGLDAQVVLAPGTSATPPIDRLAAEVLAGPSSRRAWLLAAATLAARRAERFLSRCLPPVESAARS